MDRATTSRRAFLAAATATALAGCSESTGQSPTTDGSDTTTGGTTPTTTEDTTTPAAGDVDIRRDVDFRETPQRTLALDLYLPAGEGPHPFFVFAHGGGWLTGDKTQRPMFPALVEDGIAVADIQYRLAGEKQYPAAVRDTVAAVKWVRAEGDAYGIDGARGALGGYSAGAHLAALVSVAPDVETFQPSDFHPDVSASVDALVGYSGPYDFTEAGAGENQLVEAFFGADAADETLAEGSPTTHVDGDSPPALLVHGTDDGVVPYRSTTVMAERLRSADVSVEVITGEGAGHGMIDDPTWREQTLPAQRSFLRDRLDP
jgi:acetyl esterase/lipase